MYNFLSLVNDVNMSLNEVELDQFNFSTATGWYNQAKNAVNFAIQDINSINFEWPWNHVTQTLVLTPNVSRYAYPSDAKYINFNTFRVMGNDNDRVETIPLFELDYENYLQNFSDMEYRPERHSGPPKIVFRTPGREFGVAPAPDIAYELEYEYYKIPQFLTDYDDVPSIPETFRYVINEGAMHFAYRFRGDVEMCSIAGSRFRQSVKELRSIYTNRTEYLRSTMIHY